MTDFSIDDVEGIPQRPSFLQFYMHPYTYVWPALWRQQSKESVLQEEAESDNNLKKCLNWLDLLTYGIASTVGAGIFVTLGTVVAGNINAGPSTIFSFLIAGLASLISAFCYSEFAARIPVSGSAYTFSYIALGEFVGWLIGWNLTLEYAISAAAVARGWATYVVAFFQNLNVEIPDYIAGTTVDGFVDMGPLTVYIIILCTLIILIGMKESAIFNIVMTIINISLILFIIITGATKVHSSNWTPFFPNGFGPILTGAGTLFFSYIGFDAVSTLAGEVQKPARDLPIGIVGTLGVATVLYVAVTLVITGMVPYSLVNVNAPLADAFQYVNYNWASSLVAAGSITTLTATTLTSLIGQPRIFLQMAKDGLLWDIFGKVNARQVPVFGTLVTAIGAAFIGFFLNLAELSDMISIGTLMAFTIVCAGVVILRVRPPPGTPDSELKKVLGIHPRWVPVMIIIYILFCVVMGILINHGGGYYSLILVLPLFLIYLWVQFQTVWDLPETFKCPFVPSVPLIGVAVNVVVIFSLPIFAVYRVIIWSAVGLAIYFFFGIRNSKLNQPNYHSIQKEDNKLYIVDTHGGL